MSPIILFVAVISCLYGSGQALPGLDAVTCPDSKVMGAIFAGTDKIFFDKVCGNPACKNKVGENDADLKLIKQSIFAKVLTQAFLGAEPPQKESGQAQEILIGNFNAVKGSQGDFCGQTQRDAYGKEFKKNEGKLISLLGVWGKSNCATIQNKWKGKGAEMKKTVEGWASSYVSQRCK